MISSVPVNWDICQFQVAEGRSNVLGKSEFRFCTVFIPRLSTSRSPGCLLYIWTRVVVESNHPWHQTHWTFLFGRFCSKQLYMIWRKLFWWYLSSVNTCCWSIAMDQLYHFIRTYTNKLWKLCVIFEKVRKLDIDLLVWLFSLQTSQGAEVYIKYRLCLRITEFSGKFVLNLIPSRYWSNFRHLLINYTTESRMCEYRTSKKSIRENLAKNRDDRRPFDLVIEWGSATLRNSQCMCWGK